MAKVTGKFQITLPKAVVDQCGIEIGDELEFRAVGRSILIDRPHTRRASQANKQRIEHFDQATKRQLERQAARSLPPAASRGWTREQLYTRDRAR